MKKGYKGYSRRQFLGTSISLATGLMMGTGSAFGASKTSERVTGPDSMINGVQIGTITYSFRSLPNQDVRAMLKAVVDSGISAIELMGDPAERFAGRPENPVNRRQLFSLMRKSREEELTEQEQEQLNTLQTQMSNFNDRVADWRSTVSMDRFVELRKMYNDAGVSIYAFKPRAFGPDNSDEEVVYALRAAKALGANSCTTEHPSDDAQTLRLGKIAEQHGVYIGYHNHTQATPTLWDTALDQSPYNSLNLDIGHWVAAGNPSVIDFIREKHDRITSIHVKDRTTPENGAENLMWGNGDTPIREVLQLISRENYNFPATAELEYQIPDGSNAVQEVSRCLDFCKRSLNA